MEKFHCPVSSIRLATGIVVMAISATQCPSTLELSCWFITSILRAHPYQQIGKETTIGLKLILKLRTRCVTLAVLLLCSFFLGLAEAYFP